MLIHSQHDSAMAPLVQTGTDRGWKWRCAGYVIGADRYLTDLQLDAILQLSHQVPEKTSPDEVLGGRSGIVTRQIPGLGSIALKYFTRGGLLRYFIAQRYLRVGAVRSKRQFDLMKMARDLGVNVPEPIAYLSQGRIFYRAWLVTSEVADHVTLAHLSTQDLERAEALVEPLAKQVEILVKNKIFHTDLHPGNVLVTPDDQIYLIDFDKSYIFSGDMHRLRDNYLCRWRRAVIKHRLPESLSELMCAQLRKNFRP